MTDLTSYPIVHTALFVRIQVDEYRTTSGGAYAQEVLRFSDHYTDVTINEESYIPLGKFMSVTLSRSEIRPSSNTVSITIAGIPNSAIGEIVNSKFKSSAVRIYRCFFNPTTGAQIGDPLGRYRGFVNNYSLQENYDLETRSSSNTIIIDCSSSVDILSNKYTGRKTNPSSMKKYFPTDTSMDRVPNLENTTFDFGAPKA